jgi:hypothetical protein
LKKSWSEPSSPALYFFILFLKNLRFVHFYCTSTA